MAEVLLELQDSVAVITINDPDRRNALTIDLSQELDQAVADIARIGHANRIELDDRPLLAQRGARLPEMRNELALSLLSCITI